MGSCCLCACVFKLVLGILNTVILLGGLLVAGVGGALIGLSKGSLTLIVQGIIYSILSNLNLVEKNSLSNVTSTDFTQVLQPAGVALVIIGGVIAGIALLGYCGGSIMILLKIYMLIILILVVVETIAVALFFSGTLNPYMKAAVNYTLVNHYIDLTDGGIYSMVWNVIMIQCDCCGLIDYTDFFYANHSWPRNETLKMNGGQSQTFLLQTPLACCQTSGDYPSIKFTDDQCAISPNNNNSNWDVGCWGKVSQDLSVYRPIIVFGCCLALIIQAVIALMAFVVVRDSGISKVNPI